MVRVIVYYHGRCYIVLSRDPEVRGFREQHTAETNRSGFV